VGYKDPAYVVFDGDKDKWAWGYLKGWNNNEYVDFDFRDAHDLDTMTNRAEQEQYVKGKLRERMNKSSVVMALVGESTKNLFRFVRWELELALELGLPIVVVNLNGKRDVDTAHLPGFHLQKVGPLNFLRTLSMNRRGRGGCHNGPYDVKGAVRQFHDSHQPAISTARASRLRLPGSYSFRIAKKPSSIIRPKLLITLASPAGLEPATP
jgi:hypothetical protein